MNKEDPGDGERDPSALRRGDHPVGGGDQTLPSERRTLGSGGDRAWLEHRVHRRDRHTAGAARQTGALGATGVDVQWVVASYTLFVAALVLVGGSLGDHLGRGRAFSFGVSLFAVASALCGLAQSPGGHVRGRGDGPRELGVGSAADQRQETQDRKVPLALTCIRSRASGAFAEVRPVPGYSQHHVTITQPQR